MQIAKKKKMAQSVLLNDNHGRKALSKPTTSMHHASAKPPPPRYCSRMNSIGTKRVSDNLICSLLPVEKKREAHCTDTPTASQYASVRPPAPSVVAAAGACGGSTNALAAAAADVRPIIVHGGIK